MPKLIKTWDELDGLKNDKYQIDNHVYLSTHTFYGSQYKYSTELLQKYGFDVEIDNWDKGN